MPAGFISKPLLTTFDLAMDLAVNWQGSRQIDSHNETNASLHYGWAIYTNKTAMVDFHLTLSPPLCLV